MTFLLGDEENKGGYKNKELSSGQKYKIYSRALTEVTSKKRSTDVRFLIGQAQLLAQIEVEAGKTTCQVRFLLPYVCIAYNYFFGVGDTRQTKCNFFDI